MTVSQSLSKAIVARTGIMFGALAHACGVEQEWLRREGVSLAQVRAYAQGREDVSNETAERIWIALWRVMLLRSMDAASDAAPLVQRKDAARALGQHWYTRALQIERLVSYCGDLPPCPEADLPRLWLWGIELALWAGMLPDDQLPDLASAELAAQGFGHWLHAQCRQLEIPASAGVLVGRSVGQDSDHREALRRRIARYLDGCAPQRHADVRPIGHALAGSRAVRPDVRRMFHGIARALSTARLARFVEKRAPGYASSVLTSWWALFHAVQHWAGTQAWEKRAQIMCSGLASPDAQEALAAAASGVEDPVFRRLVAATSRGLPDLTLHLGGAGAWLRASAPILGATDAARPGRYHSLANPSAAELLATGTEHSSRTRANLVVFAVLQQVAHQLLRDIMQVRQCEEQAPSGSPPKCMKRLDRQRWRESKG